MQSAWFDLLFVALTLWPSAIVLRRLGLKVQMSAVLLLSLIIPLLGHMLLALYMATQRWPHFPALPKPQPRVKL